MILDQPCVFQWLKGLAFFTTQPSGEDKHNIRNYGFFADYAYGAHKSTYHPFGVLHHLFYFWQTFFFLPKMGFKCYLSIPVVLETNGSNAPGMCARVTSRVLANHCQLFPTL